MKNSVTSSFSLSLPIALVSSAVAISLSLMLSMNMFNMHLSQTAKSVAVQGCLEVARGQNNTSGKSGAQSTSSDWQVQSAVINQDIYTKCMTEKGY